MLNCRLQTGDCLLYGKRTLIGDAIDAVTGTGLTHAGIVILLEGMPFVVDATEPTVQMRPVEADVIEGDSILVRRRPHWAGAYTLEQQAAMKAAALGMVGVTRYSVPELLANIWWQTGATPPTDDPVPLGQVPASIICAELFSRVSRVGGFDPVVGAADRATAPSDLMETAYLETICERLVITEDNKMLDGPLFLWAFARVLRTQFPDPAAALPKLLGMWAGILAGTVDADQIEALLIEIGVLAPADPVQ